MLGFLLRTGRKGPEVDRLIERVFPKGMTRVALTALAGPPTEGIVVRTTGVIGAREGLKAGDVVVAMDGFRVRDEEQYRVAREASADPVMHFIVWRDGGYLDVPARLRLGWVVNAIEDYKPGK